MRDFVGDALLSAWLLLLLLFHVAFLALQVVLSHLSLVWRVVAWEKWSLLQVTRAGFVVRESNMSGGGGGGGGHDVNNRDGECGESVNVTGGSASHDSVVLRLRNLEKIYPIAGTGECVVALRGVNLCEGCGEKGFGPIRRGEFVMILGPSGGGKTTLLNIIGTIDSPSSGSIELMGEVIDKRTPDKLLADFRLRRIGFVFQTFNLIATMTAAENVELPMTLLDNLSAKERRLRAVRLLSLVGLRNRVHHLPSELSGGEQQRVTIARSLANNPSLLLLDEPTGDLDTLNTIEIMDLLLNLNRATKTTCIMVTHNPDLECYADRILYVSNSRFVKEARNCTPQRLKYDAYVQNLQRRENLATMIERSAKDE